MYTHHAVEEKWKKRWEELDLYRVDLNDTSKPGYYILDMFPYPSGAGLHVGHPRGYIATDIVARFKSMKGFQVLHPMGWDAFGLPAENYALKKGVHPRISTAENIANFKRQLSMFGFCYDWSKEVNTTDPEYYKWTQWIFLKLYERGLAYEDEMPINWCPSCKTGLANEEVVGGVCDRCGAAVERRNLRQWVLRITEYADRLLDDLAGLDWPESIKAMQRNWIGRSVGVEMEMKVRFAGDVGELSDTLSVFTTRIDTVYGMTFVSVAPEHPIVSKVVTEHQKAAVEAYIEEAKKKSDLERTELAKTKTGVFTGSYAVNPFNDHKVPIYVADYVLGHYGTGAVMGVPAHDERDYAFAEAYGVEVAQVITAEDGGASIDEQAYTEDGILIGSEQFSGLTSAQARVEMSEWLEEKGKGHRRVNYKLNDWIFSRQRYWGEPIPVVHCEKCGVVPVPEKDLPVLLPDVESYQPSDTGESPLALIDEWVNTTCPKCAGAAKRETNTMPQWGGSCWYYLRYVDPHNTEALADKTLLEKMLPVDMYVGGAEHAVLHLLYARFWHKVLFDCGVVPTAEPFASLKNQGLIMAEDGRKMSKSLGNVINPDDIIEEYGADVLRVYEMFMGPFDQKIAWDTKGISGMKRFLQRAWSLLSDPVQMVDTLEDKKIEQVMHRTIQKVTADVEAFSFNTALSHLMVFTNELVAAERKPKPALEALTLLLAPFAPFLAQEMWETLGHDTQLFHETWPSFDAALTEASEIELVVQINGKVRAKLQVEAKISQEEVLALAKADKRIQSYLESGEIVKEIYVPGKLLNLVVRS